MNFATNGAVLALGVHNTERASGGAFLPAAAVGIGFTLTMAIFSKLHSRIDEESVPKAFRGLPVCLLCAGMIALALLAF